MNIKTLCTTSFFFLFFLCACTKKESLPDQDPVTEQPPDADNEPSVTESLSATLSGQLVKAAVEEGEDVRAILNLSETLSRDFHLEMRVAIDSDSLNAYISTPKITNLVLSIV